jgi:hypothetical protein
MSETGDWIGWFRPDDTRPWERVCRGSSLTECSKRLIDATGRRTTAKSRRFMTRGQTPEDVFKKHE